MADVFISYKREEQQAVERLAQELRRLGLDVWFDASLNAGEAFSDEIDREARAAKAILICWSPAARASDWVKSEALIGFTNKKLAACYAAGPDGFDPPAPFNSIHAEDLRAWLAAPSHTHAGWKSVLRRIGKLCGREDIEGFGALDVQAPASVLRAWLAQHEASPLFMAVDELLRARDAEEAERARLEQEARERRAREEAERRAREDAARHTREEQERRERAEREERARQEREAQAARDADETRPARRTPWALIIGGGVVAAFAIAAFIYPGFFNSTDRSADAIQALWSESGQPDEMFTGAWTLSVTSNSGASSSRPVCFAYLRVTLDRGQNPFPRATVGFSEDGGSWNTVYEGNYRVIDRQLLVDTGTRSAVFELSERGDLDTPSGCTYSKN
jgi:hypothetical protein